MKKGIVIGEKKNFITLLTPEGEFIKAKKPLPNVQIGDEIYIQQESDHPFLTWPWKTVIAACTVLVFVIVGMFTWKMSDQVHAFVTIDMDPSLELEIDDQLQVIKISAFNHEGNILIKQLTDYKQKHLSDVSKEIFSKSKDLGFIDNDVIVFSTVYEKENSKQKSEIEKTIQNVSEDIKQSSNAEITIIEATKQDRKQAKKHGLSTGKWMIEKAEGNKNIKQMNTQPTTYQVIEKNNMSINQSMQKGKSSNVIHNKVRDKVRQRYHHNKHLKRIKAKQFFEKNYVQPSNDRPHMNHKKEQHRKNSSKQKNQNHLKQQSKIKHNNQHGKKEKRKEHPSVGKNRPKPNQHVENKNKNHEKHRKEKNGPMKEKNNHGKGNNGPGKGKNSPEKGNSGPGKQKNGHNYNKKSDGH